MSASPIKYRSAELCPDKAKHAAHPSGYFAHAEWAERKMSTHDCERCPTCGYWAIWKRKARV